MKHIIKATEHERIKNAVRWDLVVYDDEKSEIKEVSEFQYFDEEE